MIAEGEGVRHVAGDTLVIGNGDRLRAGVMHGTVCKKSFISIGQTKVCHDPWRHDGLCPFGTQHDVLIRVKNIAVLSGVQILHRGIGAEAMDFPPGDHEVKPAHGLVADGKRLEAVHAQILVHNAVRHVVVKEGQVKQHVFVVIPVAQFFLDGILVFQHRCAGGKPAHICRTWLAVISFRIDVNLAVGVNLIADGKLGQGGCGIGPGAVTGDPVFILAAPAPVPCVRHDELETGIDQQLVVQVAGLVLDEQGMQLIPGILPVHGAAHRIFCPVRAGCGPVIHRNAFGVA